MFVATRVTLEAFKQLPETNQPTELIDGELIVSPTPTENHQAASMSMIAYFVRANISGTLRHAPFEIYIGGDHAPQPDLFWISPDNANCQLVGKYYTGAPDLVVEILSPSTAKRDRGIKYEIYEQYGVDEYWLVDPEALFVEVYVRENDKFMRRGVFGLGDTFTSAALGMEINLNEMLGQLA